MKRLAVLVLMLASVAVNSAGAQTAAAPATTLKSILLEQLRTTHKEKDWFVPPSLAVDGLTAEQASWKDGSGNHSIGQLTAHLVFWNEQTLSKLKGQKPAAYSGNNDETFNNFDAAKWAATVQALDAVMSELEHIVEGADDQALGKMASTIAHIGTHNAYHTGQILYVRKMKGWWDPEKGVK